MYMWRVIHALAECQKTDSFLGGLGVPLSPCEDLKAPVRCHRLINMCRVCKQLPKVPEGNRGRPVRTSVYVTLVTTCNDARHSDSNWTSGWKHRYVSSSSGIHAQTSEGEGVTVTSSR